ncbi:MAG TPA: hypothetical protein VFF07_09660 [Actinomycetota bacterium]|nr:hypothetical protein [Actinomycetota bacterium]
MRRGRRFDFVIAHDAKVLVNSWFLGPVRAAKSVRLVHVPHMFRKPIQTELALPV